MGKWLSYRAIAAGLVVVFLKPLDKFLVLPMDSS
jgi:hypothetical protein